MSFADQALTCAWLATAHATLSPAVHAVPKEIDTEVARLNLASMSISIDRLTPDQEDYLHSWRLGS
jgi:adenosylhomocysteinase